MNKQIQELADRMWRVHPSDIDAMGLKSRTEFYEYELKKFAELIVKECADFVQFYYRDHACEAIAHDMKINFGVE